MNEYDLTTPAETPPRDRRRRPITGSRRVMAATLVSAGVVLAACGASSTPATSPSAAPAGSSAVGGGSNARSGPAAGGASGTVNNVSTTTFTISTSAGQKVTVNEASSTTYEKDTRSTSASAITTGEGVLVLGITSGTTITATSGRRATDTRGCVLLGGRGGPLSARCRDHVQAEWSNPVELHPGIGNDRQRVDREQGDGGGARRLSGRHRRSRRATEQRRL